MNTAFTITARMKSKRLPLKLMRYVEGVPILEHLIDRVKLAKEPDRIILCTSTNPQDDILIDICEKKDIDYFRGDEIDVLNRLYQASVEYNLEFIGNITADSPFVDPEYIDKIFKKYMETNSDFIRCLQLPHGVYSYGVKVAALKKVVEIKDELDTEVWSDYFTKTGIFKVHELEIDKPLLKRPELRMTLDYEEDLLFFREVFKRLYKKGEVFSLCEIITLLNEHPEIVKINEHCEKLYGNHIKKSPPIKIKK